MSRYILFFLSLFCVGVVQAQTEVVSTAVNLSNCGTVKFTDLRDGKVYGTVKIGKQCWMSEDLRFGSCDSIAFTTYHKNSVQNQIGHGYWGVCLDGKSREEGHLYNWQAAMNRSDAAYNKGCTLTKESSRQGVCPEGWSLPSGGDNGEFKTLVKASGEGVFAKGLGDFNGTLSGFGFETTIHNHKLFGYYWSSTSYNNLYSYSLFLDTMQVNPQYYAASKSAGLTVRCLKTDTFDSITAGTLDDLDVVCAYTKYTFKGTPALENGEVVTSYEWSINVDGRGFTPIRDKDKDKDSLVYSNFGGGSSYILKRKAIGRFGEAEVISKVYVVPNMQSFSVSPSKVVLGDVLPTTFTASGVTTYAWKCGETELATTTSYTPEKAHFGEQTGSIKVYCVGSLDGCSVAKEVNVIIQSFKTCGDLLIDNDGNTYKTKLMKDSRCWMVEDLRFGYCSDIAFGSFFRKNAKDYIAPGYYGVCRASTVAGAGNLYNWQAAMNSELAVYAQDSNPSGNVDGNSPRQWQGICPRGWHLPSGAHGGEFQKLKSALGGRISSYSDTDPDSWLGVFGGKGNGGAVNNAGITGFYWSSTCYNSRFAYNLLLENGRDNSEYLDHKSYGGAVRCILNY